MRTLRFAVRGRVGRQWSCEPGRLIAAHGVDCVSLHKIGDDSRGYTISPSAADGLARKIADLLEQNGQTLDEIEREYLARRET